MYGYIKGTIKEIESNHIIIDNNDIGYIIYVPNPYYYKLEEIYTIYTYTHIREEEYSLYGFHNKEQLNLFLRLIQVKGVGPKMALPMLATGSVEGIYDAIERENILYLGKVNGSQMSLLATNNNKELLDALLALGYKQADVKKVIANVSTTITIEEQIKEALKLLLK